MSYNGYPPPPYGPYNQYYQNNQQPNQQYQQPYSPYPPQPQYQQQPPQPQYQQQPPPPQQSPYPPQPYQYAPPPPPPQYAYPPPPPPPPPPPQQQYYQPPAPQYGWQQPAPPAPPQQYAQPPQPQQLQQPQQPQQSQQQGQGFVTVTADDLRKLIASGYPVPGFTASSAPPQQAAQQLQGQTQPKAAAPTGDLADAFSAMSMKTSQDQTPKPAHNFPKGTGHSKWAQGPPTPVSGDDPASAKSQNSQKTNAKQPASNNPPNQNNQNAQRRTGQAGTKYSIGPRSDQEQQHTMLDQGHEYLTDFDIAKHPGPNGSHADQKVFNERHGVHVICVSCQVLRRQCSHGVPCTSCIDLGVKCEYSHAPVNHPCSRGVVCQELHPMQAEFLKKAYNVTQIPKWMFPIDPSRLKPIILNWRGEALNRYQLPPPGLAQPKKPDNPNGWEGTKPPDHILEWFLRGTKFDLWTTKPPQQPSQQPPQQPPQQPADTSKQAGQPASQPSGNTTSSPASPTGKSGEASQQAPQDSDMPEWAKTKYRNMRSWSVRDSTSYADWRNEWQADRNSRYSLGPGSHTTQAPTKQERLREWQEAPNRLRQQYYDDAAAAKAEGDKPKPPRTPPRANPAVWIKREGGKKSAPVRMPDPDGEAEEKEQQ